MQAVILKTLQNYSGLRRFLSEIAKFIFLMRRLYLADYLAGYQSSSQDPLGIQGFINENFQNLSKQRTFLLASVSQIGEHHLLTFSFQELSLSLTSKKTKQILSILEVVKIWFLIAKWCNALMSSSANLACYRLSRMCKKQKNKLKMK